MKETNEDPTEMLATILSIQNRTLTQIRRNGRIALYGLCGANGLLYGYELIIIKTRKAEEVFGKGYPIREVYPANEDWGRFAWSFGAAQEEQVMEAYKKLLDKEAELG